MIWFNLLIAWLIVGNVLVYSDNAHSCRQDPDANGIYTIAIVIVFVGYYVMGYWIYLIVVWVKAKMHENDSSKIRPNLKKKSSITASKTQQLQDSLSYQLRNDKTNFEACYICHNAFTNEQEVAIMRCNFQHFFHDYCLYEHLTKVRRACPICEVDIEDPFVPQ